MYICPFLGSLISLFWTSGYVCLGFKSQRGFLACMLLCLRAIPDSPLCFKVYYPSPCTYNSVSTVMEPLNVFLFSQHTVTLDDNGRRWFVETYFPPPPEGAIPEDNTEPPTSYYSRAAPTYLTTYTSPEITVLGKYNTASFVRWNINSKVPSRKRRWSLKSMFKTRMLISIVSRLKSLAHLVSCEIWRSH